MMNGRGKETDGRREGPERSEPSSLICRQMKLRQIKFYQVFLATVHLFHPDFKGEVNLSSHKHKNPTL